jgi:hypothetical protein
LRVCGRDRRRCARTSALTARYRPPAPEFRRISRDTTDGARPIDAAIARTDHPAFQPVEISTRSDIDNNRRATRNPLITTPLLLRRYDTAEHRGALEAAGEASDIDRRLAD